VNNAKDEADDRAAVARFDAKHFLTNRRGDPEPRG
jgi:hypothetical protein